MLLAAFTQRILSAIHEPSTRKVLGSYTAASGLLFSYLHQTGPAHHTLLATFFHFFVLSTTFLTTFICITVIRRLFFHPLKHFPGKRWAALTKLYEGKLNADGINAQYIRELHGQYGDFIRTGPNELSINHVDVLPALFSRLPFESRGPFYEVGAAVEDFNVLTIRVNQIHQKWRRIWFVYLRLTMILTATVRLIAVQGSSVPHRSSSPVHSAS